MKTIVIIPARLASTRLPEKALLDIFGESVIMRVYYQALKAAHADEVIIATDHPKIYDHVASKGAKVMMTSSSHQSGTDRIAEVAQNCHSEIIINLQGDEPIINPKQIDELIIKMKSPNVDICTQCTLITDENYIFDYNIVKVVRDINDKALYFSRQAIPAIRDLSYQHWMKQTPYYRHIGLYGFKRDTLLKLTTLQQTSYEIAESLEQLRWLQHGYDITCIETNYASIGVDTEEDLERVREFVFKETFR